MGKNSEMARMVEWFASFLRGSWELIKTLHVAAPLDLVADADVSSIRLRLKSGKTLPTGRYLVSAEVLRQKAASRDVLDVEVPLPGRSMSFQFDLRDRRTLMPIVLMRDAPSILLASKTEVGAFPLAKWRIRKIGYATFYSFLTVRFFWRLFLGAEDHQNLMDAITWHGLDGFGCAVRGDWDAALRLPHSVFTRRRLSYPDAIGLPKREMVTVSEGKLIGDLSFTSSMQEVDAILLRNARLAGLAALCLPVDWGEGRSTFSEQARRFLDNPALDFPFVFRLEFATISSAPPNENDKLRCSEVVSSLFEDPRYLRMEGRPVILLASSASPSLAAERVRSLHAASGHLPFPVLALPAGHKPPVSTKHDDLASLIEVEYATIASTQIESANDESAGLPDNPPARLCRELYDTLRNGSRKFSEWPRFVVVELSENEGACLVEDARYGYAWIESLRVAQVRHAASATPITTSPRIAVVIHAFYPELLTEILDDFRPDLFHALFVTTIAEREEEVRRILDKADVEYVLRVFENRGRDVLPFIKIYNELVSGGFDLVVKVHTKRSMHRADGDVWRQNLIKPILHASNFSRIVNAFMKDAALGMVGPDPHLTNVRNNIVMNESRVFGLGRRLGLVETEVRRAEFVAGSMFIARVAALAPMMSLALDDEDFEQEAGQLDGTLAHALERVFALSVISCGMKVRGIRDATHRHSLRERCMKFIFG